jgi:predicted nucleotidyltransferase
MVIQDYVDRLVAEFQPERVVLFGSHAEGTPTTDSDVDLLVILDHEGHWIEQASTIRTTLDRTFPLDLLVMTSDAWSQALAEGEPCSLEIQARGRVLYESRGGKTC